MTGQLLIDIWPLVIAKPAEKEQPVTDSGVRTKFYRDRKKKKKPNKPEKEETRKPYGKRGETVRIISYSEPVYIVEGVKERFPVHKDELKIL